MAAYEVRMSGHADSAIAMLDEFILAHPDNAMAYYERARAIKHFSEGSKLVSGPEDVVKAIQDVVADAKIATELDPENMIYASYYARSKFLAVYIALMMGQEDIGEMLNEAFIAYEKTLELDPCFVPTLVSLSEIYSMLPEEMGGDLAEAEYFAKVLEECDPVQGLRAQAMFIDEYADFRLFWQKAYESNGANAIISEELGRAYLLEGDIDNGKKYIDEAVSLNPENSIIIIDLARACMMSAMEKQDKSLGQEAIDESKRYLELNPDAPGPIKAYVYNMMGMISGRILGDQPLAEEYMEKKKELDRFCSRASGSPGMGLYAPPDVLVADVRYYSRPF